MKITEVLRKEKGNTGVILHKEGMFWRAYEMSANLFVEQIKKYEVKTKYYKKVKQ
ncbi:MAG: hypothetical protein GY705_11805 [Bacteroidetes bacterium]|nr:hypothetical protein [Bacteroidota bacterium]